MRIEMPKGETYDYSGDAARQVEIKALEAHGTFIRVLSNDFPRGGVCIDGRSAYTIKHKPLEAGHKRTESYIDGRRPSGPRFCVRRYQEDVETNDSPQHLNY